MLIEVGHFEYTLASLTSYEGVICYFLLVFECFQFLLLFADSLYRKVEMKCIIVLMLLEISDITSNIAGTGNFHLWTCVKMSGRLFCSEGTGAVD